MASTAYYSNLVIQQLAIRQRPSGLIERVESKEIIEASGYKAGDYAKAYGQAVSLLDAACLISNLPWLGRLIRFKKFAENLSGEWAVWAPHMPEILEAPLRRNWSPDDFSRISAALPTVGAATWWSSQKGNSHNWLRSALLASQL